MQVDVEEDLKGEDSDGKQGNDYEENNNSEEDSNYEKYSNDDEGGDNENELFAHDYFERTDQESEEDNGDEEDSDNKNELSAHEYFERIDRESENKTPGYFPSRVCYIRIYDPHWCSCWLCDVIKKGDTSLY